MHQASLPSPVVEVSGLRHAYGERVALEQLRPEQHFTQPPPRYTEASLVK